ICSSFFFSSRRRHTRFSRDWSSDVCSSDLDRREAGSQQRKKGRLRPLQTEADLVVTASNDFFEVSVPRLAGIDAQLLTRLAGWRSEERRVGKECRVWWVQDCEIEI